MEPESKLPAQATSPPPATGNAAPLPDQSVPLNGEAGNTMGDLLIFQERKERLASALSTLSLILSSEHRALILGQLRGETAMPEGSYLPVKPMQNGASWIVATCFAGCILSAAAGGLLLLDAERPDKTLAGWLLFAGVALGIAALPFRAEEKHFRKVQAAEQPKIEANAREKKRIEAIVAEVTRLAAVFRDTAKPLLDELKIPVRLDDLEGLLAELKAYEEFGHDLEDFHIKT